MANIKSELVSYRKEIEKLNAQKQKLSEYAEKHNLKIVKWYMDEGVSARKKIAKRPELQRMIRDAQRGKFKRIIFIKLDRYFRSVQEYYACQAVLDEAGVTWTATEEKYDLSNANGRAFVNMKLTIAELESDTTGERIKIVNDYNFDRIVYLGNIALKGVAQESALKMLELTAGKVATMYDSQLGFRHGPKSIINDNTLTVAYLSDDEYRRRYELDLIKEMAGQRKGNKIAVVYNKECRGIEELADYTVQINVGCEMENIMLGLDFIMFAQTLAVMKSLSMGITPDNPCPTGEVNRVVKGVILYPYTLN